MTYSHDIEQFQIGLLEQYEDSHPDRVEIQYEIRFNDGEAYLAILDTVWESDNGSDFDIDENDPRYDEFHQAGFLIKKILHDGPRRFEYSLVIDYRDFPASIIDIETGRGVYPKDQGAK